MKYGRDTGSIFLIFNGLALALVLGACAESAAPPTQNSVSVPPSPSNTAPSAVFSTNCTLLDCNVDGAASSDSDGTIADYQWTFGDGNAAFGMNASHSYGAAGDYTIILTVVDDAGSNATSSQGVAVVSAGVSNNPPTAIFTASCTDLICNFDAGSSSDTDGTVVSYDWIWGDGSVAAGQMASHTYASGGTFTVELTIADNGGAVSSSTQDLLVSAAAGPPDGQALFNNKCSTCHGADGLGGTLAKISIVGKSATDISNAIATVPNMSSLGGLTVEEIQAVADYLATL